MITAHIAQSYGRDVFAVPGRIQDAYSRGCHKLIKNNIAAILTSAEDLVHYLQWDQPAIPKQTQLIFSEHRDANSNHLLNAIQQNPNALFDDLLATTQLSWGVLNATLLQLEFEGLIRVLPGKHYQLRD
jgi:DNA processing protein